HSRSEDLERRARHPTPPTVEGIGLLFLLPFCSHNTPKQGGTRRRTTHHQTTWNRLLANAFPARSEGYRTWPCCTHNPKVAGSNPAPATMNDEGLADATAASPSRLPRLHPGITITLSSETSHTPWRRHRPSALRVRCRSGGWFGGRARRPVRS